jgi:hypothetical protein
MMSPQGGGTAPSSHTVKWNPGHYMLSYENDRSASGQIANKRSEQTAMLASGANVLGWGGRYLWSLLEPSLGVYDFSHIDADIAACNGKRVIIQVASGYSSGTQATPAYILANSTYGSSPVGGEYGWWGMNSGSGKTAAVWRAAVGARWTALFVALGNAYNGNPLVEAITLDDESVQGANLDGGNDYSVANMRTQWQSMGTASVAVMPNTLFAYQINYTPATIQDTADQMQDAYARRVAFGGPDIYGYSVAHANPAFDPFYGVWGIGVYMGVGGTTPGTDYRVKMPCVHAIQAPELNGAWATSPSDIAQFANSDLKATHLMWNYISGTGAGNWTGGANSVLATINASPITQTAYPTGTGY